VTRNRHSHALETLVAEARNAPTPALDWDRIESKLETEAPRHAAVPRPRSKAPWLLAAIVAAGTAVFFAARPAPPVAPISQEAEAPPTKSGAGIVGEALAPGSPIVATDREVVVSHPGHVVWTLEPGSEAHIERSSPTIAVALDRGALSAKVTKSPLPESFVVRVDHTRVAVHGTRFRVERLARGVKVDVEEGVVAIGPVGESGVELRAPGSAVLDLEGQRADVRRTKPAASLPEPESAAADAAAAVEAAAEPAPPNPAAKIDQVIDTVRACVAANTVARGDLTVTIGTKMSLTVQPDGHVASSRFEPPLAPAVGRCVDAAIGRLVFEATESGLVLERRLELAR
jgi:hypothetical protein